MAVLIDTSILIAYGGLDRLTRCQVRRTSGVRRT